MTYQEPFSEWEGKKPKEIMTDIADDVLDYITWYVENGDHLPKEFKGDPAGWLAVLRKIELAFSILVVGPSMESTKNREEAINEGLRLFYQHIAHLWI